MYLVRIRFLVGTFSAVILASICLFAFYGVKMPKRLELGTLSREVHIVSLPVRNRTVTNVIVQKSRTTCGCTIVDEKFPIIIQPFETHDFRISIDTRQVTGVFDKRIQLVFEKGKQVIANEVRLLATVDDRIGPQLIPASSLIGDFGVWENRKIRCEVHQSSPDFRILKIANVKGVDFSLDDRSHVPLVFFQLNNDVPSGEFSASLPIETSKGNAVFSVNGNAHQLLYPISPSIKFKKGFSNSVGTVSFACRSSRGLRIDATTDTDHPLDIQIDVQNDNLVLAELKCNIQADISYVKIVASNKFDVEELQIPAFMALNSQVE